MKEWLQTLTVRNQLNERLNSFNPLLLIRDSLPAGVETQKK
jgi:hypothetical protein